MRRMVIVSLILVIMFSGSIAFALITEPRDIDVSDCNTRWRNGRIVSVTCPGSIPG